jgi:adenine-specific DNA methylase
VLREKQIQQSYRPIIAVHKWFARRPGTLFRGLLLAEFAEPPLAEAFYQAQQFSGLRIADPFMGGGTPLLEASRIGCDIDGFDINPMAWWIVRQEIEHLDLDAYRAAAACVRVDLEQQVGEYYRTRCELCDIEVPVKYFLWVKVQDCRGCGEPIDLFPGYRVAKDSRHPHHVLVCPSCGELAEVDDPKAPGHCRHCGTALSEYVVSL